MGDVSDKVAYFQAITGLDDADLCTEILQAHGWDLELAIASFTGSNPPDDPPSASSAAAASASAGGAGSGNRQLEVGPPSAPATGGPSLTWRLITLPVSVISGGLGLVSGAIGLGMWIAGGVLSYSLGMVGLGSGSGRGDGEASARLVSVSAAAAEAMEFVASSRGSMARPQPQRRGRISEALAAFVNENFVAWGGSIRASEGFKMGNSLKASRFPFCAVVMAATNQRIALLQQVEGPKSPEEMLMILQRVLEESGPVLVSARLEAEERRTNMRLREEQDAAYRAALEADQARERQRREEQERLEREAAEAERKRKEEEEARERAEHEAAEKAAALAKLREEKSLSLGAEPEKGPNVTQVLVRFPTGERKERRFHSDATIQSLYDYVDSLDCLEMGNYTLVSNFPRVSYGSDKHSLSLKDAGLHPQASLFVELNS
ncbi:hypothetical protein NL676_011093 [Syzygium grande]|nr:hypothetical protein NL676_011093 [Syzygium grande]